MRLAASRNSVLRSSVGGGPAGAGIALIAVVVSRKRCSAASAAAPSVERAGARGDDRQDLRLELLHLHVDDADPAQVVGLERGQLRAQRRVLVLELARAGRAAAQARAADKVDQAVEDALAVGAQPVVVVLAGHPGAQVRHVRRGLLGERALDVEVLGVDRGRDRDRRSRAARPGRTAAATRARRAASAAVAQRRQRAVLLEHPREDVLAGEQLGLLVERRRAACAPPTSPSTPPSAQHASCSSA